MQGEKPMQHRVVTILPLLAALACSAGSASQNPSIRSPTPGSTDGVVRAETFATGLENPWALEFLPDGRMLVTEKAGRLRIVGKDGKVSEPLGGVPTVASAGQGGLLDVALDPKF